MLKMLNEPQKPTIHHRNTRIVFKKQAAQSGGSSKKMTSSIKDDKASCVGPDGGYRQHRTGHKRIAPKPRPRHCRLHALFIRGLERALPTRSRLVHPWRCTPADSATPGDQHIRQKTKRRLPRSQHRPATRLIPISPTPTNNQRARVPLVAPSNDKRPTPFENTVLSRIDPEMNFRQIGRKANA